MPYRRPENLSLLLVLFIGIGSNIFAAIRLNKDANIQRYRIEGKINAVQEELYRIDGELRTIHHFIKPGPMDLELKAGHQQ